MNRLRYVTAVVAFFLAVGVVLAAPPALINYQGVLRDASGDPRNGTFNMVFRFFDAQVAGSEMLIDSHIGAAGVTAANGLFSTQLGSGVVSAGAGPTTFVSLDQMFTAKDSVWLEIVINGETLSPRVRVVSAAYALNASAVDGLDSSLFLRSDTSDTYTSGTLTTAPGTVIDVNGGLWLNGELLMDHDGPDGSQAIYFFNSGSPTGASIQWDDTNNRFHVSNGLFVDGALRTNGFATIGGPQIVVGANGPDQDQILAFYEDGTPQGEYLQWDDSDDLFHLSDDLRVGGDLTVSGDDLFMGGGADTTLRLNFFNGGSPTGEIFQWDDAQDRFEMTDELAVSGPLRVGSTTTAPATYNTIGGGTPTSADISAISDLYVAADLEVGSQLYFTATDYLQGGSPSGILTSGNFTVGGNMFAQGQRLFLDSTGANLAYLEYQSAFQQFTVSEDFDINGEMSANTKNFVQNHPHDDSLSIVYTTLEGPEASTFTRGSARLEGGVARVRLDETFAWVTQPALGLTASLTPRGAWANLYVESLTPEEIVVRSADGTAPDAAFDYLVLGLRIGYEESPVVRPRKREAKLPTLDSQRARIQERPELARYTPLSRYQQIERAVTGHEVTDFTAGEALRQAVGVGRPAPVARDAESTLPGVTATPAAATAGKTTATARNSGRTQTAVAARAADESAIASAPAAGTSGASADSHASPQTGSSNAVAFDALTSSIGDVEPGDVLVLDASGAVRRADTLGDAAVVGIAMGRPIPGEDGTPQVPFKVAGIVSCRVDASGGVIRPGDLLVSSPIPGHAMRADAPLPGTILGKAMESLTAGTGTLRVLVTLR
jgi:hypothetical protein